MNPIRGVLLAGVGLLVALPAARVYTSSPPTVSMIHIDNSVMTAVQGGTGVPGDVVRIGYKQRNFKEGDNNGDLIDDFTWCLWKNNGDEITLGTTTVDSYGNFNFAPSGLSVQVYPSGPGGDKCFSGLVTYLLLHSNYGAASMPVLHWLNVEKPTTQTAFVAGSVELGNQVAAGIADGPDDGDNASLDSDVAETHADLCADGIGCGARVSWRGNGGTFQAPGVSVLDGTNILAVDREFPFVLGEMLAHAPGGSMIAFTEVPRPPINRATLFIKVQIKGLPGCGGSFGDALGLLGDIFNFF